MKNNNTVENVQGTGTTRKPSKLGTLTSIKTLIKNLTELGWIEETEGKTLDELVTFVKEKIVDEL